MLDKSQIIQPFHFSVECREKEPKTTDTKYYSVPQPLKLKAYEEDLKEYNRKYKPPVINWVKLGEGNNPGHGQVVYLTTQSKELHPDLKQNFSPGSDFYNRNGLQYYVDAQTVDKDQAYYEYHQKIFEDWKVICNDPVVLREAM